MTTQEVSDKLTDLESQLADIERQKGRIADIRKRFEKAGMQAPPALDECEVALSTTGDALAEVSAVELAVK